MDDHECFNSSIDVPELPPMHCSECGEPAFEPPESMLDCNAKLREALVELLATSCFRGITGEIMVVEWTDCVLGQWIPYEK